MTRDSLQKVRTHIEARLGGRLNDREWQRLNEEGLIAAESMQQAQVDTLVALICDRRATWGAPTAGEKTHEPITQVIEDEVAVPEEEERLAALAQILVHEARKDEAVQAFRTKHLAGGLLTCDELLDWMQNKSQADLPGIIVPYVETPIPFRVFAQAQTAQRQGKGDQLMDVPLKLPAKVLAAAQPRMLSFYLPDAGYAATVQIKDEPGGLLYDLSALSTRLANAYGWSEAEAVTFVLTDDMPRIVPARYKIEPGRLDIPAAVRIILTLHPAVAPQSVAEVYRQARQRALPGGRVRDLSEKHRLLALFAAYQATDTSPEDQMALWNAEHPDKQYQKLSYFVRDSRLALARLQQQET